MDASDFSNRHEEDEDIRLFREDYPDVYDFVLKVLDGNCDKPTLQTFKDDYGEEFLNDILKIIYGKASKKDIETFLEEYSEEIYNAIVKMIQNRKPRREDFPEAVHSREKFKKGDFIGQKYEVFGVLGEGGFGIVYLVYSHETKSAYALKTFRDEYLEDVTTRERFKKEAQVWIDLERHPYLVRASFVDEIGGRLYIAMEHIAPDDEGVNTLEGYLRRSPPDLAQTLRWAIQFCHGMEYAYSKGIKAHRDIKPANILIGQDKAVKISDFGLAGVIGESKAISGIKLGIQQNKIGFSCQTMEGVGFGTPTHMPPEQFTNAAGCDERSDIYSFGIVLYQMATGGKLPFLAPFPQNDSYEESRRFWIEMYKLHLQASAPKLDSSLFPVIRKCLEKEPRKRYQSFRKLRADLEPILKRQTGEIIVLPKAEEYDFWDMGNKAVSLDRLGRYEEAFSYYNQMLKIFPFDELTIFNKAICLTNLKRYKEAVQCYDHIIKSDSESSRAWNNKGLCFEKLGYHEEAMKCFERGLTIDPADTSLLINIGNSFYKRGKYAVASSAYSRVLEINNRDAIAWHNKGLCLYVLGEFNDASTCFSRALSIDPLYEDAWFNQGLAYHNLGDTENAVRSYDRALHLNPQRVAAWINKGKCLYLLGSLVEAIDCYNEALRMDSQNTGAWYDKALFEDKCNRHLDAFSSYKKFIELASPQDHEKIELALKRIQELKETIG